MISRAGVAAIACISLLFLTKPLAAEDIQRQKTITEIQTKLTTARDEVERLLGAQTDIYDQLDKVDAELELSSRLLRELRKQARTVKSEIQATTDTIGSLQQQSSSGNANYARHLRALYEYGEVAASVLPPVFLENTNQDDAVYLYRRLISQDKKQLVELDVDIAGHRQLLTSLMARNEELTGLTTTRQTEERQARQAVRQREQLLAKVKGEQKQKVREISDLEESSQLLGDIVAQFETEHRKAVDAFWPKERELALRMKGKLFWPVQGDVVTRFGLRRDRKSGLSSKSNGINITTVSGAKVVAASTGEVLYIGWARGLEKFVVVDHGGSIYSLYGNLDELLVSEGDQVIRGEKFATAADRQLHFEIRDGKLPVDPIEWLRK